MVGRRHTQVLQIPSDFMLVEFAKRSTLTRGETLHSNVTEKGLCIFAAECFYHLQTLSTKVSIVNVTPT